MDKKDTTIEDILKRYKNTSNIIIPKTDNHKIIDGYLSKIITPDEIKGKTILEIGGGGSQYIDVFLKYGCGNYYANDIIPERLAKNDISDPRYKEIPGNFLDIEIPEKVDIIFATLTMMMLIPIVPSFAKKIHDSLKPNGIFMSMDANHICPLSFYRYYTDRLGIHLFNPFSYARKFTNAGFKTDKIVPFTAKYPFTTGIWPLGTNFWLKTRKL